jgi:hypothetical protein
MPNAKKNGGDVDLWDCNGRSWQSWTVTGNSASATHRIINTYSGKCLDAGPNKANGSEIRVWDCNGSQWQDWFFVGADGSWHSVYSGKCIDVLASQVGKNGAFVQIWDCNGSPQQHFTWASPVSSGH